MDADANLMAGLEGLRDALHKDSLHDLADLVQSAMDRLTLFTRPLTLKECRSILNKNKHLYSRFEMANLSGCGLWKVSDDRLVKDEAFHTLFEATAFARAYLAQGGAL